MSKCGLNYWQLVNSDFKRYHNTIPQKHRVVLTYGKDLEREALEHLCPHCP